MTPGRLGAALLVAALPWAAPALGASRTVAVVVDRSGSLRYADPAGRGRDLLVLSLGLALRSGDRARVFADGEELCDVEIDAAPTSLRPVADALLAASPRRGSGALFESLRAAFAAAGPGGLVLVYGDDDLDVLSAEGDAPAVVLRRARRTSARPTREDVNLAAREVLAGVARRAKCAVVGLRAPLPPGARSVPYFEALGARAVELGEEALEVVRRLGERVAGRPLVSHSLRARGRLRLDVGGRVALLAAPGSQVAGGVSLDRDGRLWLVDAAERIALEGEALAFVAPRLPVPGTYRAYWLSNGEVRALVVGEGPPTSANDGLVLASGERRARFEGTPARARLALDATQAPREVEVLRVVRRGDLPPVVAGRRRIAVERSYVELLPVEGARADRPLRLVGRPAPGLDVDRLPVEAQEAGGLVQQVALRREEDGLLRGSFTPRSDGPLALRSLGPVELRAPESISIAPAEALRLRIVSLRGADGRPLGGPGALELDRDGRGRLEVVLRVEPRPPRPLAVALRLNGAPAGAQLDPPGPFTVAKERSIALALRWPPRVDGQPVGLRAEAEGAEPAERTLAVEPSPGPLRAVAAGALLAVALIWAGLLYRRWSRAARFADVEVGRRQLRVVGRNGRLSPEVYRLANHVDDDLRIVVEPEESPGGALSFELRPDGGVLCRGEGGARVVHADRPTILAEAVVLTHGTPFAMVYKQRALRYVYLDRDPTADELTTTYLADAMTHDEAALRDSGVFLILDDEAPNVPRYSARLEASTELLAASQEILDSASEVAFVPPSEEDAPLVSDEGVVYLDSAEGEIIDSEELPRLESGSGDAPAIRIEELYGEGDEGPA